MSDILSHLWTFAFPEIENSTLKNLWKIDFEKKITQIWY